MEEKDWYNNIDKIVASKTFSGNAYSYDDDSECLYFSDCECEWGSDYDDSIWSSVVGVVSSSMGWERESKPNRNWDSFWDNDNDSSDESSSAEDEITSAISNLGTTMLGGILGASIVGVFSSVGDVLKNVISSFEDENKKVTYEWFNTDVLGYNPYVTGWKQYGDAWYYFNSSGEMQTGWIQDENNGQWYHLDSSGKMEKYWIKDDGKDYYLYSTGEMATDWMQVGDDTWYYFNKDSGEMEKDGLFSDEDGIVYHLDSDGKMTTGWLRDGDEMDYFNSNGQRQIEGIVEDGEWHFYNANDEEISVDLGDSGRVEDDDSLEMAMSLIPGG